MPNNSPHCRKGAAPITAAVTIDGATELAARRLRVCKTAPRCFKCHDVQVQLVKFSPMAVWKCRQCKHVFTYEPLRIAR